MVRVFSIALATAVLNFGIAAFAQTQSPQPNAGAPAQPAVTQPNQAQPQSQPADPNQPVRTGERRLSINAGSVGGQSTFRSGDSELAACLIVGNEGEVFAGQLALQKSQSDEVKKFAQEMVDAHGKMIQKLHAFAGSAATASPTAATPSERQRLADANAINNQTAAAATTSAANVTAPAGNTTMNANTTTSDARRGGNLDHVALKRELGELCKQTLQREWESKSGAEFDMCYIGQQIGAHLHAIDAMKVAQNHGSDELRQILDEGIRTAEGHLQHAKDLAKKMESDVRSLNR